MGGAIYIKRLHFKILCRVQPKYVPTPAIIPGSDFGLQRGPVREPERGGLVARRSRLRLRPRRRRRTLQRGTQEDHRTGTAATGPDFKISLHKLGLKEMLMLIEMLS